MCAVAREGFRRFRRVMLVLRAAFQVRPASVRRRRRRYELCADHARSGVTLQQRPAFHFDCISFRKANAAAAANVPNARAQKEGI